MTRLASIVAATMVGLTACDEAKRSFAATPVSPDTGTESLCDEVAREILCSDLLSAEDQQAVIKRCHELFSSGNL